MAEVGESFVEYPTFVLCMTLTFAAMLMFGAGNFEVTVAQWLANLFVAAPLIGQPYVDTSYWSLVIDIVFYAWVAAFITLGIFPRRSDAIIVAWLAITFANELTIDAPIFEKLFMADDSGFFAVGLLIYQHYRGRRGAKLWALSALALGTAVFQAVHKLERLGVHTHGSFDRHAPAGGSEPDRRDSPGGGAERASSAPRGGFHREETGEAVERAERLDGQTQGRRASERSVRPLRRRSAWSQSRTVSNHLGII